MTIRKKWWIVGIILFLSLILMACSDDNTGTNNDPNNNGNNENNEVQDPGNEEPEEVTLKFAYGWGEDGFVEHYQKHVEEALPHIKLEWVDVNIGLAGDVEELLSKGIVPDMWLGAGPDQLRIMQQFEMDYAVDELFDRHNFDWSRISSDMEEATRNHVPDRQMYMIPLYMSADSLYYNKDIFDLFGVDYPVDYMTWNEVKDLAAKVTGEIEGKIYRGFDINAPQWMLEQRQVTHIDPETEEVLFMKEPIYAEYLHYLEDLWSIQGMLPDEDPGEYLYSWGANFFNDLDVAMTIAWNRFPSAEAFEESGLNWDMVTMPVWEDQPNIITPPGTNSYFIYPTRDPEHPDALYEVLEYFLSDEYQEWASRHLGRTTVLDDPEIQETIASEIEGLEDKNIESIFLMDRNPGLPAEEVSEYAILQLNALYRGVQRFADLDTDVNTFLRIMTEETEENIRQAKETE